MAILVVFILLTISPVIVEPKGTLSSTDVPPYFSWRDINGTDFTTPIKNQAPAPTCEAYALVASVAITKPQQTPSVPPPTVTGITPNSGVNTGTLSISNLAGTNFTTTGVTTVTLSRAGQADIVAADVRVALDQARHDRKRDRLCCPKLY